MKQENTRKKKRASKLKKNRFLIGFGGLLCILAIITIVKETAYTTEKTPTLSASPSVSEQLADQPQQSPSSSPSNTPISSPAPSTTPNTSMGSYNYAEPVPTSDEVDNDYFNDAIFVGDSRTEGFILYSGIQNTTSYTGRGLSVKTVFNSPLVTVGEETVSVMDAIKANQNFSKVYIMFGINELGWVSSEAFIQRYGEIIDAIKAEHPDALIYVQSIIPVTKAKSDSDKVYNNTRIHEFNTLLREMTEEKQVYYVNVSEALVDNAGCLPSEASTDGVHLNANYCKKWFAYLKTHTVSPSI